LKQQAGFLGEKTKYMVTASVDTTADPKHGFRHGFVLEANALGGYHFELFALRHADRDFYPIKVVSDATDSGTTRIHSEEELLAFLKTALGSEKTTQVVNTLLSQMV